MISSRIMIIAMASASKAFGLQTSTQSWSGQLDAEDLKSNPVDVPQSQWASVAEVAANPLNYLLKVDMSSNGDCRTGWYFPHQGNFPYGKGGLFYWATDSTAQWNQGRNYVAYWATTPYHGNQKWSFNGNYNQNGNSPASTPPDPKNFNQCSFHYQQIAISFPTPSPTPSPTTPSPTPHPTPDPTPVPTPNPTPDPTPLPTPDPTPNPTPAPTTPAPTCPDQVVVDGGDVMAIEAADHFYVSSSCSCPEGEEIVDPADCAAAACSLGQAWNVMKASNSWKLHAKGCAKRNGPLDFGLYFNKHSTGGCSDWAKAVCVRT